MTVGGGGGGSHFGGPAGTTPPLLSSGGLGTSRAELVSKETMFTDRRKAHSRPWWGEKEGALSGELAGIGCLR